MRPDVSVIRWLYLCAKYLSFAQQFFPMLMFLQPRGRLVTVHLNALRPNGTNIKRERECRIPGK